jgi:hypothetical protein
MRLRESAEIPATGTAVAQLREIERLSPEALVYNTMAS